jgi:Zn-dependent protease with chaperone function/tellurite resistance protein
LNTEELRAQGERDLTAALLADAGVKAAMAQVEKDKRRAGARHRLLSSALRLTPDMAPDVEEIIQACRGTLEMQTPVETYVYPSPLFNAAAVRPERGVLFMMLSSSLLEAFEAPELRFVVGHELGHHAFEHHRIPLGLLLENERNPAPPDLVLKAFAWQRYAEISADRAGLVCAGRLEPAASALFKLASGLRGGRIDVRIDRFLEQAHELVDEVEHMELAEARARGDWFASHPFSPLRLEAARHFARSRAMKEGGVAVAEIEPDVEAVMSLMMPGYLHERSDTAEVMRRLLFSGAVLVAHASGGMSDVEAERIEALLGDGTLPRDLDVAAVREDLPRRIARFVDEVPPLRRGQVLRDLTLVARADGSVDAAELAVLHQIADAVGVPRSLIAATASAPVKLD